LARPVVSAQVPPPAPTPVPCVPKSVTIGPIVGQLSGSEPCPLTLFNSSNQTVVVHTFQIFNCVRSDDCTLEGLTREIILQPHQQWQMFIDAEVCTPPAGVPEIVGCPDSQKRISLDWSINYGYLKPPGHSPVPRPTARAIANSPLASGQSSAKPGSTFSQNAQPRTQAPISAEACLELDHDVSHDDPQHYYHYKNVCQRAIKIVKLCKTHNMPGVGCQAVNVPIGPGESVRMPMPEYVEDGDGTFYQ
jgi:hypothetical protein